MHPAASLVTLLTKSILGAVSAPRKAPGEIFDTYLGMLYPTEDYKVYGYISNTRIKFILVVDEMLQKEDEVRMVRIAQCLEKLLSFFTMMCTSLPAIARPPFYTADG